jgi:hypothetical protein
MGKERKVLHIEGVATRDRPEPCVGRSRGRRRSVGRGRAGPAIEPRNRRSLGCRRVVDRRKATPARPRSGALAAECPARALQLLRRARQQRGAVRLPPPGGATVAAFASRRSQRAYVTWERMDRIAARWLPPARILHPWPEARFDATTPRQKPSELDAHAGICAGGCPKARMDEVPNGRRAVPTATVSPLIAGGSRAAGRGGWDWGVAAARWVAAGPRGLGAGVC